MFGIVSDLHYHDWQNYAKVDSSGKNSRLEDIKNCMSQVLSGTHEAGAKDLWVLGDVFHKRGMVDTISLSYFSDFVAEARHFGIHLHVLVGNHDMATQDSSGYTSLDPWKSAGNVTIYGEDIVVRRGNSTIAVLPYEENHLNLQFKLNRLPEVDYLFGHLGAAGAILSSTDFRVQEGVIIKNAKVRKGIFLGHYHTPQELPTKSGVPAYYVGSPMHHTFSDEGQQKRYFIVNDELNKISSVPTKYPEFITLNAHSLEHVLTGICKENVYRVRLHGVLPTQELIEALQTNTKSYSLQLIPKEKGQDVSSTAEFSRSKAIRDYVENEAKHPTKVYKLVKGLLDDTL